MNTLKSALVATDFSREAGSAVRRAASIARETGIHGALVHILPSSLPPDMQVRAASKARQALSVVAEELKAEGLSFEPRLVSGDVDRELAQAASDFDLVIAGARGGNVLLDFALGRTSVRLVRESRRPTLIVKRPPEGPYRRVLAAVDFSEPSRAAAAFGARVAPQADFDFVHAFEVEFESTLRLAGLEEDKIERYRREARDKAMCAMDEFARGLAAPRERIWPVVTRGYPPKIILERADEAGAQLIVIGKHAAGVVERVLIGSVALQVLEMARCDVLVVPEHAG
jgi:nucleotide-binding universal stress UspA family protein